MFQEARKSLSPYRCVCKSSEPFQSYQRKVEQQTRVTPQTQQHHTRFTQDSRNEQKRDTRKESEETRRRLKTLLSVRATDNVLDLPQNIH